MEQLTDDELLLDGSGHGSGGVGAGATASGAHGAAAAGASSAASPLPGGGRENRGSIASPMTPVEFMPLTRRPSLFDDLDKEVNICISLYSSLGTHKLTVLKKISKIFILVQ